MDRHALPSRFSHNFLLQVIGAYSLEEMVAKLKRPRRIMLMVKAGQAVDDFIKKLVPLLSKGDIIIGMYVSKKCALKR